ncbi:hypothetical protein [Arabidopsis thaliana]|uniref:Uncharacterized protein AT4g36370 n=4 Tax=Arabidopsis TaxID=3701 RepID=O65521_ARATH|nr:uncharacterized protein AT4G36370 [Arabidopsis thaliana]KAG7618629.1 hypothetical protein ISN45_At04g038620 [Arabidopsis thaliana x Arabidopsis arenosa]KAG7623093.1 hypothetical protein ISN44_As04g038180 [Arabidopsis suecica]AEE86648.1 hypothetical protein AT4G36370 [Arabidopsis thaliana]CAA0397678.1 unnamed protein product [Arabidopsis thaliana]CAA18138.1 hypothetical protein [Arabidopsis thaliana]|eukprot:NP_195355.1 hypothetical protein AT4G36370 [Arabidopsis thaliana]
MLNIGGVDDDIERLHKFDNNGNNYKLNVYIMISRHRPSVEVNEVIIILSIETSRRFFDIFSSKFSRA